MATWEQLFRNERHILRFPQPEVIKFVQRLESAFQERPLKVWDQCCGGGRHGIAVAKMGHQAFASDVSRTGVSNLIQWAADSGLACHTAVADMTQNPWTADQKFHGIICWDSLHHNTIKNIETAMDVFRCALVDNGLLMVSLISTHSGSGGEGKEIEKNTFIAEDGLEAGVPHHYFEEKGVRSLFRQWKICILAEVLVDYLEVEKEFYKNNPFPYTKWNVLARKEP
jgi:2-polyprenyl-3-methyl-5-hydroxy-6-metoxy-1,4-benzoquinol methylase